MEAIAKRKAAFKATNIDTRPTAKAHGKAAAQQRADGAAARRGLAKATITSSPVYADSKPAACVNKVTQLCVAGDMSDIQNTYDLKRVLSGGKSGAFIFLVQDKAERAGILSRVLGGWFGAGETEAGAPRETYILKLYPDTFSDAGHLLNERPLREISTLCSLGHVEGFPEVFAYGCTTMPTEWLSSMSGGAHFQHGIVAKDYSRQRMPYVVMSLAEGVELSKLDLNAMTDENLAGMLLQMLYSLRLAKDEMGSDFEHFDFHPDNIFVDVNECFDQVIYRGLRISCPRVNIIDFDLVNSKYFRGKPFSSVLAEHTAKRKNAPYIPERTLAFAKKWLSTEELTAAISALAHVHNTDIRNWLVYLIVVARKVGFTPIMCTDVDDCIEKNYVLFKKYLSFLRRRGVAEDGERIDLYPLTGRLTAYEPVERMLVMLFGSKLDELKRVALSDLDGEYMRVYGHHVNQDNLALSIQATSPTAMTFGIIIRGRELVDITAQNVEIVVMAKQSVPIVKINFTPSLRVGFHELVGSAMDVFWNTWRSLVGSNGSNLNAAHGFEVRSKLGMPEGSMHIDITSITAETDGKVLKLQVEFDISSVIIRTLAAGAEYMGKLSHVSGNKYIIRDEMSLQGEPNECSKYVAGTASLEACKQYVNGLLMSVVHNALNEQVRQAVAQLNIVRHARLDVYLQARAPGGAVLVQVPIEQPEAARKAAQKLTPLQVAQFMRKTHGGKASVLDIVKFIGRAWEGL